MTNIILENKHFCLTLGEDGIAKSLIHKTSGQECLDQTELMSMFSLSEPRPYNNEIKLAYPNKRTTYQANYIRREGNKLIVRFEVIPIEATIEIKETDNYISFRLAEFGVTQKEHVGLSMDYPPVEAFRLLQLPVKNRKHFGQWLNVSWDEDVAINAMATSLYAQIDAERRHNCRMMTADAYADIRLKGAEVALIVTESDNLLKAIDVLEEDYDLPRGARARMGKDVHRSYYAARWANPETVDDHIEACKKCGFTRATVYYGSIFPDNCYDGTGQYDRFVYTYPNGLADVKLVVDKFRAAGIIPGLHTMHSHIGLNTKYISPVADHRLSIKRHYTLAQPLDLEQTTVYVEEDPSYAPMHERCRILQFGGELIYYTGYCAARPYCFTGCTRGHIGTNIVEHPLGQIGGVLDVSEFEARSCHINQDSSLQDEVATELAKAYNLGFGFVYLDGSEGTPPPFGYQIARSQYSFFSKLNPAPDCGEGAAKTHFGWHMLPGGNAFDVFPPEVFKEMIRVHPAAEAPRLREDFTRLDFGWWKIYPHTQPDQWEFGASLSAAWDCIVAIQGDLPYMPNNPRMDDLFEILRRWEDVRINNLLTDEQKKQIRENDRQEHILLINEDKQYEVVPYDEIPTQNSDLHAFVFQRRDHRYVVYWHGTGEGKVRIALKDAKVYNELYEAPIALEDANVIPVSHRRYVCTTMSREEIVEAFTKAELI